MVVKGSIAVVIRGAPVLSTSMALWSLFFAHTWCIASLYSLSDAVAGRGCPRNGKQEGRCWRCYVLESIPGITILRAYLVASTCRRELSLWHCVMAHAGGALPAEHWVAEAKRSCSHHLGSSGLSPLHMCASWTSLTCRWICMAFSMDMEVLCCDGTDEPRGLVCAMVKVEFGLGRTRRASLQRHSCLVFSAAAA